MGRSVGDGRFVSRDSWAGNYDTPTTLNRWVYVVANPVNLLDPSGNKPTTIWQLAKFTDNREKPPINTNWDWDSMKRMHEDMEDIAKAYASAYNRQLTRNIYQRHKNIPKNMWILLVLSEKNCFGYYDLASLISPWEAFRKIHKGPIEIKRISEIRGVWGESQSSNLIHIFSNMTIDDVVTHPRFIVHEIGHSFENAMAGTIGRRVAYYPKNYSDSGLAGKPFIQGNKWGRQELPTELYNTRGDGINNYGGFFAGHLVWQFSKDFGGYNPEFDTDGRGEIFADMFVGWVYGKWEIDPNNPNELSSLGQMRKDYMDQRMDQWIFDMIQVRMGKVSIPYIIDGKDVWKRAR